MTAIKVAILLTLFIFAIFIQVWANPIKSMNDAANQVTIMKMDKNKDVIQKKIGSAKEPIKSLKKSKTRSQSAIPYTDYGAILGSTKVDVNFLKALEEKKRSQWVGSLDKVIYSYPFPQNLWRDKFFSFCEVTETKSSNSDFSQSILKRYPDVNKYFEEGRILETFKLLQSKKEEIFKEICMGFRFSFSPVSGHMFIEMNVTPSSEKGPGIIIPF